MSFAGHAFNVAHEVATQKKPGGSREVEMTG